MAYVKRHPNLVLAVALLGLLALFPLTRDPLDNFTDDCIIALAYVVMALGLNIVVGFAGLLDLGYVAFYAIGAYTVGWFASDFYTVLSEKGVHLGVSEFASSLPGFHFNWLLLALIAAAIAAIAGIIIGLPTLRLRGDYIAIVTLAFGEIIGRFAANGEDINPSKGVDAITFGLIGETEGMKLTNGRSILSTGVIPWRPLVSLYSPMCSASPLIATRPMISPKASVTMAM